MLCRLFSFFEAIRITFQVFHCCIYQKNHKKGGNGPNEFLVQLVEIRRGVYVRRNSKLQWWLCLLRCSGEALYRSRKAANQNKLKIANQNKLSLVPCSNILASSNKHDIYIVESSKLMLSYTDELLTLFFKCKSKFYISNPSKGRVRSCNGC